HVDQVLGIHRVSWEDINTPDSTVSSEASGVATGVIKIDDHLVVILDFEKIVSSINPSTALKVSDIEETSEEKVRDRSKSPVMIAEDSPLLSKLIVDCLKKAGYTNLNVNGNGQEAWDKLCEMKKNGTILNDVHCIVTDIEMPKMDGHRLCKLVKSDEDMKHIPVIIFSSLINDDIRRKGESVGADAQLTKPEIGKLVKAIDDFVDKYESAREAKEF
ncbi:MAG: chemotaxis protein, partial [Candidatus Weimeria sp.]